MTLFGKPADQEDGRRWHLSSPGCQVFYASEIEGGRGEKKKRPFNSCKYLLEWQVSGRGMCYFHFLTFAGDQGQIISLWAKQKHVSLRVRQRGQGSLRQATMYDYNNKKMAKTRVKVRNIWSGMKWEWTLPGYVLTKGGMHLITAWFWPMQYLQT